MTPEERNAVHLYKKRRQAGGFGAASSPSQGIFVESSTLHTICIKIDTDRAESSLTGQSTLALALQPLPFIYLNHLPGVLLSILKSEISYSVKLAESTAAWAEHFRIQDSLLRFAIERPLNRNRSNAT